VITLDDLADECPPEVIAHLDDTVEVAPGVTKRLGDCTMEDAAGNLEASIERTLNLGEIVDLLRRAKAEKIIVPPELLTRGGAAVSGPQVIAVRNELRELVRGAR